MIPTQFYLLDGYRSGDYQDAVSLSLCVCIQTLAKSYRKKIEEELDSTCKEVLDLLDKYLVNAAVDRRKESANDAESAVFYLKMKGDYYR